MVILKNVPSYFVQTGPLHKLASGFGSCR